MKEFSKIVSALNDMVGVNSQRVDLYKDLAERSKKIELKLLYIQYAIQAQTFTATLNKWRHCYGEISVSKKKKNFFQSAISKLKQLIFMGNDTSDLIMCELLESKALRVYQRAVALSLFPGQAINDIEKQIKELEKSQVTLKSLRQNGSYQWQAAFG